ncbi:MAG: hypothetical protein IKJ81_03885 [Bacteroidales bacterium]|nr:hypothetical protein [Bacteroidales bacterium]
MRRRKEDRIARAIAASHNMLDDYKAARRGGLTPIEALEEWDLLDEEAIKRLNVRTNET